MAVLSSAGASAALVTAVPSAVHPDYATWSPVWRKLAHVYEGSGGFLDGTYLVGHPREYQDHQNETPVVPTKKLLTRRKLARYENVAAAIIDGKADGLFRDTPFRSVGDQDDEDRPDSPIELWWQDVDGRGTSIDEFWRTAWVQAAVFGHVFVMMDQPRMEIVPLTQADIPAPFLRLYSPLDVIDWLTDEQGHLAAVRLLEAMPRLSMGEAASTAIRIRELTLTGWRLLERGPRVGDPLVLADQGTWEYGRLPVVVLYAKRRPLVPVIGQSVLSDPDLYADLYNLTSELRELLRNQTFGILNVQLGPDEDAQTARENMGTVKGTENVLFTKGPSAYIQPDTQNVTVYQEERQQLLRTIHRLTKTPWESDTKDAESAQSLDNKREDFHQSMAGFANELERADLDLADLWYRVTSPVGSEAGALQMEADQVQIRWPTQFGEQALSQDLADVSALKAIGMGKTAMAEVRKRLVPKVLPDLPPGTAEKIASEIDAIDDMAMEQERISLLGDATSE